MKIRLYYRHRKSDLKAIFVFLILLISGCADFGDIPKDEDLIAEFDKYRLEYERAICFFKGKEGVFRIEPGKKESYAAYMEPIPYTDEMGILFPSSLFPDLIVGTNQTSGQLEEGLRVTFFQYRSGFLDEGEVKGIAYMSVPPKPEVVLKSLDELSNNEHRSVKVAVNGVRYYRALPSKNWYLFFQAG